jgi:hypothetical protein
VTNVTDSKLLQLMPLSACTQHELWSRETLRSDDLHNDPGHQRQEAVVAGAMDDRAAITHRRDGHTRLRGADTHRRKPDSRLASMNPRCITHGALSHAKCPAPGVRSTVFR